MKFIILTPFFRAHNIPALVKNLKEAGVDQWIVIHDGFESPEIEAAAREHPWINPVAYINKDGLNMHFVPYAKANLALNMIEEGAFDIEGDYYVGVICDDDTYDPGLMDALKARAAANGNPEVIAISARRCDHTPECRGILHATKENMKCCHVGFEQVFIRGDVFRSYRFEEEHSTADGRLFERVGKERQVLYCPDLFVDWNSLPA